MTAQDDSATMTASPPATARGRAGFIEWLRLLPAASFSVEPGSGGIVVSAQLNDLLPEGDDALSTERLAALTGREQLSGESLRRAAVSCGPRSGATPRRLWALVPVESDSGDVLVVGLHIGRGPGETPAAQERAFQAAMDEPERRHGINQPLTALSFLLENLLHAFETSQPDRDYQYRKTADLVQQVQQLRILLHVSGDAS